jgi:glutamate carboxypeptidase
MLADLEDLVKVESPSDDPAALDRAVEVLAAKFTAGGGASWPDLGATVERVPPAAPGPGGGGRAAPEAPTGAAHLLVRFPDAPASGDPVPAADGPGRQPEGRQVLLLGHIDTVWPVGTLAKRPFRVENGKAFGPGAYDMKAGLVVALWALRALAACGRRPPRPVTLLVNTDEEVGSRTSEAVIEAEARRSAAVLVLEPALPDGAVKTWRKGVGRFRVEVVGRAAHAGAEPEKGVSAVEELACQILRLQELTDLETGTTVNVGVIGGGTRANVVAERAWAEVDVRVMTREEADRIQEVILGLRPVLPGAGLEISGGVGRLPMERNELTLALYAEAREVAARLGFDLPESGTGGASDGNITSALGVPTLDGLGAAGDGAHAEHEHVDVASLPPRAALLAGLIELI